MLQDLKKKSSKSAGGSLAVCGIVVVILLAILWNTGLPELFQTPVNLNSHMRYF